MDEMRRAPQAGPVDAVDHDLIGRLEKVTPELAALRQVVFCGRELIAFEFGNAPFQFRFVPDRARFTAQLALQLRLGSASAWLLFESIDVVGEEWAGIFSSLDPLLARALLVEEVTRHFEQVTLACGERVQLTDLHIGPAFPESALRQALRIEGVTTGVGVRAVLCADTPEFFTGLATAMAKRPSRQREAPDAARIPVQISLGAASLPHAELTLTRPGDILILPTIGTLAALLADCRDRRGRKLPVRARLEGRTGCLTRYEGEVMVQERNEMTVPTDNPIAMEEVSIPVTAVLGEIDLPVRAFGALQAGYVFDLPSQIENACVYLYCGSRRVGTGRLVAIGERLGVRVVEWGGAGNGDDA